MASGGMREGLPWTAYGFLRDDTRRLSLRDYEEALGEVISVASSQGALSVYTYGEVSVPGISDLDVLVVSEKPLSFNTLSSKTLWITSHTPEVVSPRDFEVLGRRVDTRRLRHVWGRDLGTPEVDEGSKPEIAVNYALRKVISVHKALTVRNPSARNLLLHLNSPKHNYTLLGMDIPPFFRRVDELRRGWFSRSEGKLKDLLELSLEFFDVMEGFLSSFPGGEHPSPPKRLHNWLFHVGRSRFPRPKPLPLSGKVSEIAYYLNLYTAEVPHGVLKLIRPSSPPGWRGFLTALKLHFREAGPSQDKG